MEKYNTRVSVQLDFNFVNTADGSLHPEEVREGVMQILNSLDIKDLGNLQGFQQNSINFAVKDIKKLSSPEDEIENDLMEYDIF